MLSNKIIIINPPNQDIVDFIHYILATKVKLNNNPKIIFETAPHKGKRLAGYYSIANYVQIFPTTTNAHTLCNTVAHELRHAEQWQNKFIPWSAKTKCEQDANKYAAIWCWDYFYEKADPL